MKELGSIQHRASMRWPDLDVHVALEHSDSVVFQDERTKSQWCECIVFATARGTNRHENRVHEVRGGRVPYSELHPHDQRRGAAEAGAIERLLSRLTEAQP